MQIVCHGERLGLDSPGSTHSAEVWPCLRDPSTHASGHCLYPLKPLNSHVQVQRYDGTAQVLACPRPRFLSS